MPSTRPLDLTAKVTKLLKDKDDITVRKRLSQNSKYTPTVVPPANAAASPRSTPPQTRPIAVSPASSGMPPLEPDVDDEFAAILRRKRQPPPVGSVFRSGHKSSNPYASQINTVPSDESETYPDSA